MGLADLGGVSAHVGNNNCAILGKRANCKAASKVYIFIIL